MLMTTSSSARVNPRCWGHARRRNTLSYRPGRACYEAFSKRRSMSLLTWQTTEMPLASIVVVAPGTVRHGEADPGLSKQGRLDAVRMGELISDTKCMLIAGGTRRAVKETIDILADCCVLERSIDARLDVTSAAALEKAIVALSEALSPHDPRCIVVCAPQIATWQDLAARRTEMAGAPVRYLHSGGWIVEPRANHSTTTKRKDAV